MAEKKQRILNVLFISSGNSNDGISPIILNQGNSLNALPNISISYFTIKGKGLAGYLRNAFRIRTELKRGNYNIIHAHYGLSGAAASLAFPKLPLVVSLMGSDLKLGRLWLALIRFLSKNHWAETVVKSEDMKQILAVEHAHVIPNGVDLSGYEFMEKSEAQKKVGFDPSKKHLLFLSDPQRPEKNYYLAEKAWQLLGRDDVELHPVYNQPHAKIREYLFAADILILSSLWEGSPNVIKEAMACNRPIVSTDVGDVRRLLGDEPGHFISGFYPEDMALQMNNALVFVDKQNSTVGRRRLIELKLNINEVVNQIINVYKNLV